MPYIQPKARARLDADVDALLEKLQTDGELNYAITRLVDGFVKRLAGAGKRPTYHDYLIGLGTFRAAGAEFYRRRVAPYEDQKAAENGDVFR